MKTIFIFTLTCPGIIQIMAPILKPFFGEMGALDFSNNTLTPGTT
jgi:hypothetical protein